MAINPYDPRMQACFIASTVTAVAGITALAIRYLFPKEQLSPSPMAQRNVQDMSMDFLKTQLPKTISSSSVSSQESPKEGSLLEAVDHHDLEALKKLIPWYQSHRNQENVETEIKSAFNRAFEDLRIPHFPGDNINTLSTFKLLDNTLVTPKIRSQALEKIEYYRPMGSCISRLIKEYPEFYDKPRQES